MFKLLSHVRIKELGITGEIIDISVKKGKTVYIVESDIKEPPRTADAYPSEWPLYDCFENEIEAV